MDDELPLGQTAEKPSQRRTSEPAAQSRKGGKRPSRSRAGTANNSPGADLERRVARIEFGEGALARLRVPIRVDADSGRDVLTDIDVLAVDVDGRLRVARSILECKSGKGQSGEPDRLLWLAGLQRYLGFDRAVLVRQSVSRRGRGLARTLGLRVMDVPKLSSRETAHGWLPDRFAHVDSDVCLAAEARTDTQLKGLAHIPADLVGFLRNEALRRDSHECLRALVALESAAADEGILPSPAREVIAGHSLIVLIFGALQDAGRLDEISPDELTQRTSRALTVGSPDDDHILSVLGRADEFLDLMIERVHNAYARAGANRQQIEIPSLTGVVSAAPQWLARYVDLVEKLRANPAVARELLQTAELACFEAGLGGKAHEAEAFDFLFTAEHRYLLRLAIRCLDEIVGKAVTDPLHALLDLDFARNFERVHDRAPAPKAVQRLESASSETDS